MTSPPARLSVVSQGFPSARSGASVVLFFFYIAELAKAGYQIQHVVLIEDAQPDAKKQADYIEDISIHPNVDVVVRPVPKLVRRKAFAGFVLNEAAAREALSCVAEFKPDLLYGIDLLSYWAAEVIDVPKRIIWVGDLNYQTRWYRALISAKETPKRILKLPSAWKVARYWRKAYAKVLRSADEVVVSSGSSVEQMRQLGIDSVYHPYPWPVSEDGVRPSRTPPDGTVPSFLYCGGLDALGSKSALHFILLKLYPRMVEEWGEQGFQLIIAGYGQPEKWARDQMDKLPRVDFRGFVDDIAEVMKDCHAMIVPIDIPVGNRSRIVTALARRWLTIAHVFTRAGNPDLIDAKTCYIADDAESFVNKMKRAYENPDEAEAVREGGYQMFMEKFSPEAAVAPLIQLIERQLQKP